LLPSSASAKTDRYKLEYLSQGGLVMDMNSSLNYSCLTKKL
jgi:hypothetical protein